MHFGSLDKRIVGEYRANSELITISLPRRVNDVEISTSTAQRIVAFPCGDKLLSCIVRHFQGADDVSEGQSISTVSELTSLAPITWALSTSLTPKAWYIGNSIA